jgi:hypothetical protein
MEYVVGHVVFDVVKNEVNIFIGFERTNHENLPFVIRQESDGSTCNP